MNLQFVNRRTQINAPLDRADARNALATIREEWEVAAEGESLVDIAASVGLLLLDIAVKLGMTPDEQKMALGAKLYQDAFQRTQQS
jgi:hypothetical protein